MTEHVTIPASVGDATIHLKGIDRLLTAKNWERAAIVAAFVELDLPPGPKPIGDGVDSPHLTGTAQFAALQITGLRGKAEVRRYAQAWQSTGLPRPKPGETVELPNMPWPPSDSTKGAVTRNAKSVAALLAEDEAFRSKILDLMGDDGISALIEAIAKSRPQIEGPEPTPKLPRPWSITEAKSKVLVAVEALVRDAIAEHPEGYGESGPSHANEVGRYISELVAFCAWLIDPSEPYADPTAEHFDIAEGPLFVSDILGGSR